MSGSSASSSSSSESRESMARMVAKAQAEINAASQMALQEETLKVCVARCLPSAPADKLTERQRRCLEDCAVSFQETYRVAGETLASIYKREQQ